MEKWEIKQKIEEELRQYLVKEKIYQRFLT